MFLTSFSDTHFQSLVATPKIKLEKSPKQKFWIGKIWSVEELFYYNYPFYLPNFFQQKLTKYELEVRFKFIQVFHSVNIETYFIQLVQFFKD